MQSKIQNPKLTLPPGSVVGVFGSGQLGRMLGMAARRLGYRVHTFSPGTDTPTGMLADREVSAAYTDLDALRDFVRGVDVITFEFENVPAEVARMADEEGVPVRPGDHVLRTAQNRLREKAFFVRNSLPVAPFAPVHALADLEVALLTLGTPAVLKTAAFGYDGKGQVKIDAPDQAAAAWEAIGRQPAILENFIDFEEEVSVVAARGVDGSFAHFGVMENSHIDHILDITVAPAPVSPAVVANAVAHTRTIMEKLGVVGVLCVEFFLTWDEHLLINEIAPRPHNSGHLTVDACVTDQFEQQLRAVCGMPLGSTAYHRPAAMANLLGDLWADGEPNWAAALAFPNVKLHLYGKTDPRPGRKMGHLTVLGATIEEARAVVIAARKALLSSIEY